jgi:hypothetical protein
MCYDLFMEEKPSKGRPATPDKKREEIVNLLVQKDRIRPKEVARVTGMSLAYVYQVRAELKRTGQLGGE